MADKWFSVVFAVLVLLVAVVASHGNLGSDVVLVEREFDWPTIRSLVPATSYSFVEVLVVTMSSILLAAIPVIGVGVVLFSLTALMVKVVQRKRPGSAGRKRC